MGLITMELDIKALQTRIGRLEWILIKILQTDGCQLSDRRLDELSNSSEGHRRNGRVAQLDSSTSLLSWMS